MERWEVVERPGYSGRHRDEKHRQWDREYGQGNWRLAWQVGETHVDLLGVCALYEDGYFHFLNNNPPILNQLINEASDVYDDDPLNIDARFDYSYQKTDLTHLQDVAIRTVLIRMGLWFKGKELIQIRDKQGKHPLSMTLSPGRVPFHMPDLILKPELTGWWEEGSIESFYQSNKFLEAKF